MRARGASRRSSPVFLAVLLGTASHIVAPGVRAQGLTIQLGQSTLLVSGFEPGSQIVLLSVERRPADFAARLETVVRSSADTDADGSIAFELETPPAEASIWLAVDAASGQFGMTSPIDGAPFAFPEPLGLAAHPGTGAGVIGAEGHTSLRLILVRPGAGAWQLTAVDGGMAENTGVADGRVALYAPEWEPVAGTLEVPGDLQATDVLFAVDPDALAVDAQLFGGLNALP